MAKKKKKLIGSEQDAKIRAKRTGYRFKTDDIKALHKKDGSLNKKGQELAKKKPTEDEVSKYKKRKTRSGKSKYPDKTKQVYHEKRNARDHSDDFPKKSYPSLADGGGITEISVSELTAKLGRTPNYPHEFINGKKYVKCFMRPYYQLAE